MRPFRSLPRSPLDGEMEDYRAVNGRVNGKLLEMADGIRSFLGACWF